MKRVATTAQAEELWAQGRLPDPRDPLSREIVDQGPARTLEDRLKQVSRATRFLAVGHAHIGAAGKRCTATWLGERDNRTYLLTAAHCVPRSEGTVELPTQAEFFGWNGVKWAGGQGVVHYLPPRRGHTIRDLDEDTDIAVLELATLVPAVGRDGVALDPPLIYDGDNEGSQTVDFVGYGRTGKAGGVLAGAEPGGAHAPNGFRRQWGRSGPPEVSPRSLRALRDDTAENWAETSPGDSGSAWWQTHGGYPVIVATTCCGSRETDSKGDSVGARLSPRVDWLRARAPVVRTWSERLTVSTLAPFVSRDVEVDAGEGRVFFSMVAGSGGSAPTGLWSGRRGVSLLRAGVQDSDTGARAEVVLLAERDMGCALKRKLRYPSSCTGMTLGPLVVSFRSEDNPELPRGRWVGEFELEAKGQFDSPYQVRFPVHIRLHLSDKSASSEPSQATERVSPSPQRLLTQRPQIVGCAGLAPTSAR
ncbi:hypothetical protein CDN99_15030 [Roseateles aquatilis]|uniref:Peptidase S1 domain-containing protein n=1 Tax=Roseateles aquatilis TaxID=431061 RepID=A0A246J8C2_9BURK|nr:hypothetical protein CDN99_15030 [Roseateles aquatilis]